MGNVGKINMPHIQITDLGKINVECDSLTLIYTSINGQVSFGTNDAHVTIWIAEENAAQFYKNVINSFLLHNINHYFLKKNLFPPSKNK
jgi:hypothetical protein